MAQAIRIDKIITQPNGVISVLYNCGQPPLTADTTAEIQFYSLEDLNRRVKEFNDSIEEISMALLHLAITYLKKDGTTNPPSAVEGKTVTFDTLAQSVIKVQ